MAVVNLTPHSVEVYSAHQFVNLEQLNPTTWVADGVEGAPLAAYPSQGLARVATKTSPVEGLWIKGEVVRTVYGQITGLDDLGVFDVNVDLIIVSLPTKQAAIDTKHELADCMVSPYKVVRDRTNGSLVLGCMGFTC